MEFQKKMMILTASMAKTQMKKALMNLTENIGIRRRRAVTRLELSVKLN
jgi:hypothetical protein